MRLPLALLFLAGCYEPGNDDYVGHPTLSFEFDAYAAAEADRKATITVIRTASTEGAVSVTIVDEGGSATAGADYEFSSTTLEWAAGETGPKSFDVVVIHDASTEGDETVTFALRDSFGAQLGAIPRATLTIQDSEGPPAGTFQFASTNTDVDEGARTASVTITRTGGNSGGVILTIDDTTSGSAASGSDYRFETTTIRWPDGDMSSKTVLVTILEDESPEGSETIGLRLTVTEGAGATGTQSTTTVTIRDND